MRGALHREATDLRLSPSDSLYVIVQGKIRENQIEFGDFEKSWNNDMEKTSMSVSGKSPTSSPCTRITLRERMLYESFILTLRGSVALREKSSSNPATNLQKSWKTWFSRFSWKNALPEATYTHAELEPQRSYRPETFTIRFLIRYSSGENSGESKWIQGFREIIK